MSENALPIKYILAAIVVIVIIAAGFYVYTGMQTGPKVEQVNIAVFMPLSGAQSVYGHDILQGVQFAVEEINDQGGIKSLGGAKINLIVVDITSDATQAVSIVEDALTRYDLTAAVGPGLSYLMIAVQPVFIKHKVPAVTGAISVDILKNNPKGEPWVFMMGPNSSLFGATSGDFLKYISQTQGFTPKIAVVHGNTEYEVTTAEAAKDKFESLGFEVVLFEEYATPLVDATPLVQKIASSGANIVYPVSYLTDAELIIKTMKVQDVKAIVIGGGAGYLYPAFYEALGDDVAYVFSVSQWNYDLWPETKVNEYKQKYGVMFPQEQVGVNYAGVWVLKEAIEKAASTDSVKVAQVIRTLDITSGPAGTPGYYGVKFDDMGWNTRAVAVMVEWLPGGELVTVYPSKVATHEIVFP